MALRTSIFAILCTVAATATTVNAAPSVRSVGGSGAFSGTTAATNATGNAQRAGSLRVSGVVRPVAKVTKSGITTFDEKGNATTVSRAASAPRLSIGKYLGVPKGQSISMDAVPNQLTNQISNIEGDIVDIRGILQYIQETMAEHHTVYIEFVPDPQHQDTDFVLQWYYTDEVNPEIHRLFSTYDLRGLGDPVQLRATDEYFQWKYESETEEAWRNLAPVPQDGEDGQDGAKVELRKYPSSEPTEIQYRYEDANQGADDNWQPLIELSAISGTNGAAVEMQVQNCNDGTSCSSQCIQYQHQGDESWTDLMCLDGLGGGSTPGREIAMRTDACNAGGTDTSDALYDQISSQCFQWHYTTASSTSTDPVQQAADMAWHNLMVVPANGADAHEVEFGVGGCANHGSIVVGGNTITNFESGAQCIQWRKIANNGEDPDSFDWTNIIRLEDLRGPAGANGREIAMGTGLCSTGSTPENGVDLTGETGDCFQWHYTSGNQTWYNLAVVPVGGGNSGRTTMVNVQPCSEATGAKRNGLDASRQCLAWAYSDEANSTNQTTRENAWTNLHYADFGALAFKNKVDTIDIEDSAVTTVKIANGNVTMPKLDQQLQSDLQTILNALSTTGMTEEQYVLGVNKNANGVGYSYEWKEMVAPSTTGTTPTTPEP